MVLETIVALSLASRQLLKSTSKILKLLGMVGILFVQVVTEHLKLTALPPNI